MDDPNHPANPGTLPFADQLADRVSSFDQVQWAAGAIREAHGPAIDAKMMIHGCRDVLG
jgi:hypothetical protein